MRCMVSTRWRSGHCVQNDLHGCSSNVSSICSRNYRFVFTEIIPVIFSLSESSEPVRKGRNLQPESKDCKVYWFYLVIWLYQNVLGSYLEPYVGPLINPVMKSICSKLDPYIGQYVPGISSYASKADSSSCCSGSTACSETVPKAEEQSTDVSVTKRRVKKAD